jgi:hypothetical protein
VFSEASSGIDIGRVEIRRLNSGAQVHVNFLTSNGWRVCVFNDVGCFDYIESAVDPWGNELAYEDLNGAGDTFAGPERAEVWGILDYSEVDPLFPDQVGGPAEHA